MDSNHDHNEVFLLQDAGHFVFPADLQPALFIKRVQLFGAELIPAETEGNEKIAEAILVQPGHGKALVEIGKFAVAVAHGEASGS